MTTFQSLLVDGAKGWHSGGGQIKYSFINTIPDYYEAIDTNDDGVEDAFSITDGSTLPLSTTNVALTANEKALAQQAVAAWNAVANTKITAVNGIGDITFARGNFGDASLFGFVSDFPGKLGQPSNHGDLWINTSNPLQNNPVLGNTGWNTFLHELGHALGLHHPDEDPDNTKNDPQNNNQWTVMSYVAHPGQEGIPDDQQAFSLTPMIFDIQAIQQLYGANLTTNTGDTAYVSGAGAKFALANGGTIGGKTAIFTIWDAGGVDTIDASNQTGKVSINLNPGTFSTIGAMKNNIGVAAAVTVNGAVVNYIENAKGGKAADTLIGNATKNVLHDGGPGTQADTMRGGGQDDTYWIHNSGAVVVEGANEGTGDRVKAGVDYTLATTAYVEFLETVNAAATTPLKLTGNARTQSITGNAGDNILHDGGTFKADTLRGLAGNDTYKVYNTGDVIIEGISEGTADKVVSAVDYTLGATVYVELMTTDNSVGIAGIDLTGNDFNQRITGNAGANILKGQGGTDFLFGMNGKDTLTGGAGKDYFVLNTAATAANADVFTDFNVADDTVMLDDIAFKALPTGTLAAAAFRANLTGAAGDATDRIVYETDTGKVFYDADGLGGGAGIHIATLTGLPAINNLDFTVV